MVACMPKDPKSVTRVHILPAMSSAVTGQIDMR